MEILRKKYLPKKIILFSLACAIILSCAPKVSKSTSATANSAPVPVTPAPVKDPNEALLAAAKTKFPNITGDVLTQGRGIYYGGACINCHAAKNISNWDESQWVGILDNMAIQAKLTANEKDVVWKFIIAVKLAGK
jgi:hypothetical protein